MKRKNLQRAEALLKVLDTNHEAQVCSGPTGLHSASWEPITIDGERMFKVSLHVAASSLYKGFILAEDKDAIAALIFAAIGRGEGFAKGRLREIGVTLDDQLEAAE